MFCFRGVIKMEALPVLVVLPILLDQMRGRIASAQKQSKSVLLFV